MKFRTITRVFIWLCARRTVFTKAVRGWPIENALMYAAMLVEADLALIANDEDRLKRAVDEIKYLMD